MGSSQAKQGGRMIQDAARFQAAMDRLDEANREDPRREVFRGKDYPKELLYALRMTEWLERLAPDASEALRLAVRGQHICRWTIPRESYPKDRKGYLQWRTALGRFHAEEAGGILREAGYGEAEIVSAMDPSARETVNTKHHEQPRYVMGMGAPQMLMGAPVVNHTDAELTFLEALVGRRPPFVSEPGYQPGSY